MNFTRRTATAVVVSLLVAVGLAACGGSSSSSNTSSGAKSNGVASESANSILTSTSKAADALKSVRVSGSVKESQGQIGLDLTLKAGGGAQGSISLNGHKVQLVTLDGSVYLNGDTGFWTAFGGGAAAALLSGKWLKAPATGDFAGIADLGSITTLFNKTFASHGTLAKGGQTTVDGMPAIAVKDTTQGGTLYVATTGQPYPLEILGSGGNSTDKLSFTNFNAPVTITVPKNAVDLSQLQSGS